MPALAEETTMTVATFMDDIDAPDIAVFSSTEVVAVAQKLVDFYD